MRNFMLLFPFILTGLIVITYGNVTADNNWAGISSFTLWNCLPLGLAAIIFVPAVKQHPVHRSRSYLWSEIALAAGILGSTLFFQLAWRLDWWALRTGSAQSGLIFVFAPLWELALGWVGFGMGWLSGRIKRARVRSTSTIERSASAVQRYVLLRLGAISAFVFAGMPLYTALRT
jgi:hypothetical protein